MRIASLTTGVLLTFASAGAADEILMDGVAAQVGNEIVLISEVEELARPVEQRMREAGAGAEQIQTLRGDVLERLIETKLIENVVDRFELGATPEEIDNAIAGIAQDSGLTVAQVHRSVQSHGLTIEEYRRKLKSEIERSKVINAMVRSRVRVPPEEVRKVFEERYGEQKEGGDEVHLRYILVAAGGESMRSQRTACMIAEDALAKIRGGEIAFPDMARRVSDYSPDEAGELGWLHAEDIAPWMAEAIAGLEPGEVSDVIPNSMGCNLIELVERRSFAPVTFEQAEQSIIMELSGQMMDREYLEWLETLRKQTYISRKGLYAEGARTGQVLR